MMQGPSTRLRQILQIPVSRSQEVKKMGDTDTTVNTGVGDVAEAGAGAAAAAIVKECAAAAGGVGSGNSFGVYQLSLS